MEVHLEAQWRAVLQAEFKKPYFKELSDFVAQAYQTQVVFPQRSHIFKAFELTPFDAVKVVLIGQDPYHGPNQANGLSFSVNHGLPLPPSLRNIYRELQEDMHIPMARTGNLEQWAQQGVLLLNATLTVAQKSPGSHQKQGWETFTTAVIEKLSSEKQHLVFILWGAYAQKKGAQIDRSKHLVLESAHPSPFAVYRGFYGSKPFSKTNAYLEAQGLQPIHWEVERSLFS